MNDLQYEALPSEPPAKTLSIPRTFILAVYWRLRLSNIRLDRSAISAAKRLLGESDG